MINFKKSEQIKLASRSGESVSTLIGCLSITVANVDCEQLGRKWTCVQVGNVIQSAQQDSIFGMLGGMASTFYILREDHDQLALYTAIGVEGDQMLGVAFGADAVRDPEHVSQDSPTSLSDFIKDIVSKQHPNVFEGDIIRATKYLTQGVIAGFLNKTTPNVFLHTIDLSQLEHQGLVEIESLIDGHYALTLTNRPADLNKIDIQMLGYDESRLQLRNALLKAGDLSVNPDLYVIDIDNLIRTVTVHLNLDGLSDDLMRMMDQLTVTVHIDEIEKVDEQG